MKKREISTLSEEIQVMLHLGLGEKYPLSHLAGKRYYLMGDKSKVFKIDEKGVLVSNYK